MLLPFDPTESHTAEYDLCIVGTGPAGITLALELANKGLQILILEAGGLDYTAESQDFYECESVGHEGWPKLTRLRFFGGTSNHWSGRCRPFDASDFNRPSVNSLPGWPIDYSELDKYLAPAMKIIDIDDSGGFKPISTTTFDGHFYPDKSAQSPPTRFKEKYIDEIKNNPNIHCFYNATAVDLGLDSHHISVQSILVRHYNGGQTQFKAKTFILALGGIENPRLLLNCKSQIKEGLGNSHDMVGRCFMEHLNVSLGSFIYKNPDQSSQMQFYTDAQFSNAYDIGQSNVTLSIVKTVKSYGRTRAIKNFFKNLACEMELSEKIDYLSDFKCPGMGNISTLMEQSPNLHSRVMLSAQRDAMGLQRAKFDWQLNDYDRNTIKTIGQQFAKDFQKAGLGNVKLENFVIQASDENTIKFSRHAHHMGTTRMSILPAHGVVDENCKVHGLDNLYIAGSSVFSTGGACNPTMPIIQLCLRMVDHLVKKSTFPVKT